mgnify:CR=1 FL=1
MTKLRVHELAKELGMDNKELLDILAKKKPPKSTTLAVHRALEDSNSRPFGP